MMSYLLSIGSFSDNKITEYFSLCSHYHVLENDAQPSKREGPFKCIQHH